MIILDETYAFYELLFGSEGIYTLNETQDASAQSTD